MPRNEKETDKHDPKPLYVLGYPGKDAHQRRLEAQPSRLDINSVSGDSRDLEIGKKRRSFSRVAKAAILVRNWLISTSDETEKRSEIDPSSVFQLPSALRTQLTEQAAPLPQNDAITPQKVDENLPPIVPEPNQPSFMTKIMDEFIKCIKDIICFYVDPNGQFYYFWTTLISIGVLYNMMALSIFIFDDIFFGYFKQWLVMNSFFDALFVIDIFVQSRTTFLLDGSSVESIRMIAKNYVSSSRLILDLLCLVPLDLLLLIQSSASVVRVTRLFKTYRIMEFHAYTIKIIPFPAAFRILSVVFTCYVIFHWNACIYFLFSIMQGIDNATDTGFVFSYKKVFNPVIPTCDILLEDADETCAYNEVKFDLLDPDETVPLDRTPYIEELMTYWRGRGYSEWTFSNFTREYSMSIYWSSLTITTCGQQPWPENSSQNMLECVDTLIGLMVFSVIIGSVGNVVSVMNKRRADYQEKMDAIKFYMKYRKVNPAIQDRVLNCFVYMASQNQLTDERDVLEVLPPRLTGQIAVSLHMETLQKVELFADCEVNFLYELVLRLQQHVFSPGDYICRTGDRAKEMFILKRGRLSVIDDVNPDSVVELEVLCEGSTFGELSVVHVAGNLLGDRRAVSVRSVGFADIYILAQEDVSAVLVEYPSMRDHLYAKAREMLRAKLLLDEEEVDDNQGLLGMLTLPTDEQLSRLQLAIEQIERQLEKEEQKHRQSNDRITNLLTSANPDVNNSTQQQTTNPTTLQPTSIQNLTGKIPVVFGIRVELPPDDPFGYDKHGVCIVTPDEEFKVVVYGNHLDKLDKIVFTATNSCLESTRVLDHSNHFIQHFVHRAAFKLKLPLLPEQVHAYKMCIIPKNIPENFVMKPLDDFSTMITTERPPKEYLLPLPLQLALIAFLLSLSALFSGLTLGLMSMTTQELQLVCKSGSVQEQKYAAKILPIRKKGNLLLCSLLLGNVIVNSAISILLGELTSGIYALIGSTLGIVIFGEILPQSICVKKGLAVGAHTIQITQFFIFLTFPVAWPVSKLLDRLLGGEYITYNRKRLMELMKMSMKEDALASNELKIAVGAMELADKVVRQVMTRIEDVFMLPETTILNAKTIANIIKMGYTRIPVYANGDKNNITDLLFVKDLALIDPDDNFTVRTVCGYHKHEVKYVRDDTPLAVLLESFKKGEGHLAIVKRLVSGSEEMSNEVFELVGVCTLEDIVEEILQAEIVDEFDVITDNVNRTKRKMTTAPRDMTRFFDKEAPLIQISMHLQMVAMQWLVANTEAFKDTYISKEVLERLVKNSARRVDLSSLQAVSQVTGDHNELNVPRLAKLYAKDEPSDRFILILEGRVHVTIGQGGMMFEAGPWHCFGTEILQKLTQGAATLSRSTSIIDSTDLSMRRPDLMFKPDFSAVIKEDSTYLEVTVAQYINAYKASLMQREKERDRDSHSQGSPFSSPKLPLRKSTEEPLIGKHDNEVRRTMKEARNAVEALNQHERSRKSRSESRGSRNEEGMELLKANHGDDYTSEEE
ncbi:unnamed protein product, partial [Mesorhabditis belari]|uniref:Uncharacterized protein n=1 Tax=Mesorhabditis belari TaxID=2138241 RepID=A0AAF3FHT9_9BILA